MGPPLRRQLERVWAASSRPAWAPGLFWAGWCVPPVGARVMMNVGQGIWPALTDVRGLLSDLMVGSGWALLGLILLRVFGGWATRMGLAVLALLWTMSNYAAFEHVLALDSPVDLALIGYLGDETWVAGSSSMIAHPLVLLSLMLFAPVAVYRATGHLARGRTRLLPTAGVLAALLVLTQLWTPSLGALSWRQLHFLEFAPVRVFATTTTAAANPDDPELLAMFAPELDGARRTPIPERPPNVLIVMIEGMTGAYVPPLAAAHGMDYHLDMPRLADRAVRQGLYLSSFINQQRQTNRGEYAILCGDHPKLSSQTSKMSDYVIDPDRACLPTVLREAGYHTAYLQAANLRFMMKDQFMTLAGFDELRGAEFFTQGYARSGWGVDDRGLYEDVLATLVGYERRNQPWFATVLTVGTHAPYPVPDDFEGPPDEPPEERAFRYADFAVDQLLDGLEREGLADHTLVLITSDESSGLEGGDHGDFTQILANNWGVMIALGPDIEPEHEPGTFVQSDIAISVLDYLGLAEPDTAFSGRSFFRRYPSPRRVGFANAYLHIGYTLDTEGHLLMCPETGDACVGYQLDPARIFADAQSARTPEPEQISFLRGLIARTEATAASRRRENREVQEFELIDPRANVVALETTDPHTTILSGQAMLVPPKHRYHVELRYRAVGPGIEVFLDNTVWTRGQIPRFQPWSGPLHEGDSITLEYDYVPSETAYDVDVVLKALDQSNAKAKAKGATKAIEVERAVARLEPLPLDSEPETGFEMREFSILRRDGSREDLPYHRVDLESLQFWRHGCVRENKRGPKAGARWSGRHCREGEAIRGPGSFVPDGGTVRASLALVGTRGSGRGHVELRAAKGREKRGDRSEYGTYQPFSIEPGQRVEIAFDELMPTYQEEVRLTLVFDEAESVDFDIETFELEVFPPEALIRWASERTPR